MTDPKTTRLSEGWPEPRDFRASVRTEFSLLVVGMMVAVMLVSGFIISRQYVNTVTHHTVKSLLTQARSFSATAGPQMISGSGTSRLMLRSYCHKLVSDNPDVYWAGVADRERNFVAHTQMQQVLQGVRLPTFEHAPDHDLLKAGETFVLRSDTIYIVIPMNEEGIHLGYLALASSTRGVREARWSSIQTVASITLIILLLGIPFTVFWLRSRLRPLTQITASLRQIDLNNLTERLPFVGRNEFGYLAETIRTMGTKLNFAQREIVEKERLAKELQIARDIQYSILPRQYPSSPRFEFAGTYRSAKEVGGDYYDFIDFDAEHLAFIIADVSGKSLPGMLVMLLTRDIVKQLTHGIRQPADLLSEVNRELHANIKEGMFVTMLYGLLDKRTGHCAFASAGHNSLIHLAGTSGQCRTIKTRGFPLGLVGPGAFGGRIESGEVTLARDEWLIAYTDGINEAKNEQGEQFGMNRLLSLIQGKRDLSPGALVQATLNEHEAFVGAAPQYDDITLLALKWHGEVGEPAPEAPTQHSVNSV